MTTQTPGEAIVTAEMLKGMRDQSLWCSHATDKTLVWILHLSGLPQRVAELEARLQEAEKYAAKWRKFLVDSRRSGSSRYGENASGVKLSELDVIAIRDSTANISELAKKYGVTGQTIKNVRQGRTWRHLLPDAIRCD